MDTSTLCRDAAAHNTVRFLDELRAIDGPMNTKSEYLA